ncbi:MAG TPA: YetF domain-containing protein [Flavobacterium sp.]|jgi:uncharacterized membrane protein YcaP (DUF421 family)
MKKIEAFELDRMLFGEAPPEFMIEVFFRGLALYLFMLFIVRFLGKRMAGEVTIAQMVLMIMLGGTLTIAMQVPEGGTLVGFVALGMAFVLERGFSYLNMVYPTVEKMSQGMEQVLIKDGILQISNMKSLRLTHRQLYGALRNRQIKQLGEVERMYLEPNGTFSIYRFEKDIPPGLPVFPPQDRKILEEQEKPAGIKACKNCGHTAKEEQYCSICNENEWTNAIL